ncbi:RodZ family helix-turn-helix domain-containing protein [Ralstonia sp. ASV6]|uniref:helix-turn-helix domain-containing protein n=1 Tax=Ralstonia sp. ASV6 TaxID=2795124 RepID=UPI0018EACFEC|nr:helix-turn-helix domain-containing protein [Ralstonia sp. ASV6]
MDTALTPKDLGTLLKNTRKALGKTQEDVARALKTRRQTIADLEAGKNVGTHVMFNMLLFLGKGVGITDVRPTVDTIASFLEDDE